MSPTAFVLVLVAAFAHASWNLFAKRGASGGVAFQWLVCVISVVGFTPVGVWKLFGDQTTLGLTGFGFIVGSVVIHSVYVAVLQRGYRLGDMSVVYPVARGLGPVLVIVGAVLLFGERPSVQAVTGALVVCTAVAYLGFAGRAARLGHHAVTPALGWACLTAVSIASYTLWDSYTVTTLAVDPLAFTWVSELLRFAGLTVVIWPGRARLRPVWKEHAKSAIGVAILSTTAYVLVLIAFTLAPVSSVAPVREVSIVIGTFLGARLLAERQTKRRLAVAALVLAGVLLVLTG